MYPAPVRGTRTPDTLELCLWSREFSKCHPNGRDTSVESRFGIGIYQMAQGKQWKQGAAKHESMAAASIHFMCTAEMMNIDLWQYLPSDIRHIDFGPANTEELLCYIGWAWQMITYKRLCKGKDRASRWDPGKLCRALALLVEKCMGTVPIEGRIGAFYDAMEIMTGRL